MGPLRLFNKWLTGQFGRHEMPVPDEEMLTPDKVVLALDEDWPEEAAELRAQLERADLLFRQAADASGLYGVPEDQREYFESVLASHGLEPHAASLARLARPGHRLETTDDPMVPGATRLGGSPDLPPGMEWPKEGEEHYAFVAQVDLSTLAPLPGMPLPPEGLLSFFLGDCDNCEDAGGKVLFLEGPVETRELPANAKFVGEEGIRRGRSVRLVPCLSLPLYGDGALRAFGIPDDDDAVHEASNELQGIRGSSRQVASFVGGHPRDLWGIGSFILFGHEDPRFNSGSEIRRRIDEAEFWSRRLEAHDWWMSHQEEVARKFHQWVCLLDLDSHDDCDMCWSDVGFLLFMIRRDDLAERRFDRIRVLVMSS